MDNIRTALAHIRFQVERRDISCLARLQNIRDLALGELPVEKSDNERVERAYSYRLEMGDMSCEFGFRTYADMIRFLRANYPHVLRGDATAAACEAKQ